MAPASHAWMFCSVGRGSQHETCCSTVVAPCWAKTGTLSQETPNPDFLPPCRGARMEKKKKEGRGCVGTVLNSQSSLGLIHFACMCVCDLKTSINYPGEWRHKTLDIHHASVYICGPFKIPPPCNPTQCFATLNCLIFFPWSHLKPPRLSD